MYRSVPQDMAVIKTFKLNTGAEMPAVGLRTWQSTDEEAETQTAAKTAIPARYRHIDMAWRYGNEKEVGEGIRASGVPRKELFLTDKIWGTYHSQAQEALDTSLAALGVHYLDLWLMHWCAIGVSNFSTYNLEKLLTIAKLVPAVNQPGIAKRKNIQLVAHSPLGSPDSKLLCEEGICEIAERHGKSSAQILISWGAGKGWGVLPKSASEVSFWHLGKKSV
ncbi:2-methylbutyraldehyde reductase [Hyaloscypha variabilis]